MKTVSLIILSIPLAIPYLYAETPYEVTDMLILPHKFYVGDLVEIRLHLQYASSAEMKPVDTLPQSKWLSIKDVHILSEEKGKAEVRIYFSSYHPGTHLLPELQMGDIVIRNLKVNTNSVLEEEGVQRLRTLQHQAVIPLTWFKIIVFLCSICVIPFLLVKGFFLVVNKIRGYEYKRKKKIPFVRVQAALNRLGSRRSQNNPKLFFQELSSRMREYLEDKLGISAEAYTTSELKKALPAVLVETRIVHNLISILRTSDSVKFGNRHAGTREMADLVRKAKETVEEVEREQADVES